MTTDLLAPRGEIIKVVFYFISLFFFLREKQKKVNDGYGDGCVDLRRSPITICHVTTVFKGIDLYNYELVGS